jgi:putative transposase
MTTEQKWLQADHWSQIFWTASYGMQESRSTLLGDNQRRSRTRAVLEAWRHDYNEQRPHSKLGWLTPGAYASALSGENGRDAALRRGSAPRPLATHETEDSNRLRTLVIRG